MQGGGEERLHAQTQILGSADLGPNRTAIGHHQLSTANDITTATATNQTGTANQKPPAVPHRPSHLAAITWAVLPDDAPFSATVISCVRWPRERHVPDCMRLGGMRLPVLRV